MTCCDGGGCRNGCDGGGEVSAIDCGYGCTMRYVTVTSSDEKCDDGSPVRSSTNAFDLGCDYGYDLCDCGEVICYESGSGISSLDVTSSRLLRGAVRMCRA